MCGQVGEANNFNKASSAYFEQLITMSAFDLLCKLELVSVRELAFAIRIPSFCAPMIF